ncbi:MAG: hypothetical protein ACRDYY_12835 [Acidimicrobiales bacterium]
MLFTALLTIHLIGVALGLGGATIGDLAVLRSLRRTEPAPREQLIHLSRSIWLGLALLGASGAALFALNPSSYLHSAGFIAKMVLVAGLVLNGIFLHPRLSKLRMSRGVVVSGAISVVSWYGSLAIAMFRTELDLTLPAYVSLYALAVAIVSVLYLVVHAHLGSSGGAAGSNQGCGAATMTHTRSHSDDRTSDPEAGLTVVEREELVRLCLEDEELRKALSSYVRQHA